MTIKIGMIGSRTRVAQEDLNLVSNEFLKLTRRIVTAQLMDVYPRFEMVSGGQELGADGWAQQMAKIAGVPIKVYYPDWERWNRSAGPIRNEFIVRDADVLIAAPAEGSKGTVDCINKFKKLKPNGELIIV